MNSFQIDKSRENFSDLHYKKYKEVLQSEKNDTKEKFDSEKIKNNEDVKYVGKYNF